MIKWFLLCILILSGCTPVDFEGEWSLINNLAKYHLKKDGAYEFQLVNGIQEEGSWQVMKDGNGVLLDDSIKLLLKNDSLILFNDFIFQKKIREAGPLPPLEYFVGRSFHLVSLNSSRSSSKFHFTSDSTFINLDRKSSSKSTRMWSYIEFDGNAFLYLENLPDTNHYLRISAKDKDENLILAYYDFHIKKIRESKLIVL